jgi:hypothetical protein
MKRINAEKEVPILIEKMLNGRSTYDFVMENQKIDGVPWFQYFTWDEEEEEEYRKWFMERFLKVHKYPKKLAEREFSWFNLMWGLKRSDWV